MNKIRFTSDELNIHFNEWLNAWNEHNLDKVMNLIHEDIVFENWSGGSVSGKNSLKKLWTPWFINHEHFKFIKEDTFFDEKEQRMLFMWRLIWPSQQKASNGEKEIRRGVDVLYFENKKIIKKLTYTKTTVQLESVRNI